MVNVISLVLSCPISPKLDSLDMCLHEMKKILQKEALFCSAKRMFKIYFYKSVINIYPKI